MYIRSRNRFRSFIHPWAHSVPQERRRDGSSAFSICDGTGAFEEMMAMAWFCVLYGNICRWELIIKNPWLADAAAAVLLSSHACENFFSGSSSVISRHLVSLYPSAVGCSTMWSESNATTTTTPPSRSLMNLRLPDLATASARSTFHLTLVTVGGGAQC